MSSEDVEKEKGNAAFRREDYASALKHYDKAIKMAGSGAGAALFSNKAATLLKLSEYDACVQQCLKGLAAPDLMPELKTKIFCRMATAYEAQGKVDEAMEALKQCEFTPALLLNSSNLLRKLWVRSPEAVRAYCNLQLEQLRACGDDATALSLTLQMEQMSIGDNPKDQSRAKLISEHSKKLAYYKEVVRQYRSRQMRLQCTTGNSPGSGHVSTAILSDLKSILVGELRFGEVNVGRLLICRTIAEPVPPLSTLIEDPAGAVARLSLSNWCSPDEDINNVLPSGTYLAIKEPWYTKAADGKPAIRVDIHADVLYLEQTHPLLKNVKWRTPAPEGAATSGTNVGPDSWESFERRGNEFFVARNYELAVAAYTDAIELKRKVAPNKEVADLLANRAAAFLADGKPMDAFWDCQSALFVQPGHLKATLRLAKAHANLSKYEEAKVGLEKSPHSTRPDFQIEISRLNRLIREQQFGEYDLKALLKEAAATETPHLDHADYNGGVEVKWISEEKGNGLLALRDFAPGDLLFVGKAFEAIYKSEWSGIRTCVSAGKLAMNDLSLDECVSRIIRRISKNPDLVKLDEGELPVVDSARVAAIVSRNTFGSLDLQVQTPDNDDLRSFDEVRSGFYFGGRGLWILASFMNHTCVPNTARFFVGDILFVRASKPIAKGEELTSSYAGSNYDYNQRQEVLELAYGFKCECELCVCDWKRVRDQPSLDDQREAAIESFNAMVDSHAVDHPESLAEFIEDARMAAEKFSNRLAYKDRYDLSLQGIYKSLANGYSDQRRWLQAAKAFEVAYSAVVGNGTQTTGTFNYSSRSSDEIFLCFKIGCSYLLAQDFAKAKEYLGKVQSAAKVALGSDDVELLATLYPGVPVEKLFKDAFGNKK